MLLRFGFTVAAIILCSQTLCASAASDSAPLNDTVKITVPVHMKEMSNDINQFAVDCSFRYVGGNHGVYGNPPEHGTNGGPLIGGKFDGNVVVTITRSSTPPDKINGYFCTLSVYSPTHGYALVGDAGGEYYPGKKGTDLTEYVDGSF
jgi:hypothetical protein